MKRAGFSSVILASVVAVAATWSPARKASEPSACDSRVAPCFAIKDRAGGALVDAQAHLPDLVSSNSFDGKYFKAVLGASDEAIRFDADSKVALKAATAYYHMAKARAWFLARKEFQVEPFKSTLQEKVVIRIDETLPFSPTIHFKTDGEVVHNGARSFRPPKDWEKDDDTPAWGYETFFFKPQLVRSTSAADYIAGLVTSPQYKSSLRSNLLYGDSLDLSRDLLDDGKIDPVIHLINVGFSLGLTEIIPTTLATLAKLFKRSEYLDAALVPEICYHEYSHTVLGPVFSNYSVVSTALNEGYPNYFAYKISGLDVLAKRTGRKIQRGFAPKDAHESSRYHFSDDYSKNAARQSFAFSVLVDLEEALGQDGFPILIGALRRDPEAPKPYIDQDTRLKKDYTGTPDLDDALTAAIGDYAGGDVDRKMALLNTMRGVLQSRSLL